MYYVFFFQESPRLSMKVKYKIFTGGQIKCSSPGAGGNLLAMKRAEDFSFFFVNYTYIDNLLEYPWVVLVKKYTKPSGQYMAKKVGQPTSAPRLY